MHALRIAIATLCSVLLPASAALAQNNYPNRPIKMIVGFAAGGGADVQSRVVAHALSERLKQTIVVENRVGAGSQVGGIAIARAEPDGYSIGIGTIAFAIQAGIDPSPEFDPLRDLAWIGMTGEAPYVLVVNAQLPIKNVPELLNWIRARAETPYASAGVGSGLHLTGEMFREAAKLKLVHVPYRGEGPAVNDVASGQVPFMFSSIANARPMMQTGKVRAIAVASLARSTELPELQTMGEGGLPGIEMSGWAGVVAPKRVPAEIVARLAQELGIVLQSPEVKAQFVKLGSQVRSTASPQEFTAFMQREVARYKDIATRANISMNK